MKHTISVTAEDIQQGVRTSDCKCPVALALIRVFKCRVHVCCNAISIEDYAKLIERPKKVVTFIDAFDSGQEVKPFKFELEILPNNHLI